MARVSIKVTKSAKRTVTKTKVGKSRNKSKGNPNKCPICGKFVGSGKNG